jgi:hypothetical protein
MRWLLWTEGHLIEAQKLLEQEPAFSISEISYFLPSSDIQSPILPCAIVDERIVNFGWGYLGRQDREDVSVVLKHPQAVSAFVDYFDFLWHDSIVLKVQGERQLDQDKLRLITQEIKNRQSTRIQVDREEAFNELEKDYVESKKSINIISWKILQTNQVDALKKSYFSVLEKHLHDFPEIEHRRILWRPEHLDVLDQMSEGFNEISNAEIAFFAPSEGIETPILPCTIVDNKIINFGWGYLGRPLMDEVNITLRQPEAIRAFSEYFAFLWQNGIILKERNKKIDRARLAELREKYSLPEITIQSSLEEAYNHLIQTYKSSKVSINNISWKNLQVQNDDPLRAKYFNDMIDRIKNPPIIAFRRLFWSVEHLQYLEDIADVYNNLPNVEFRFFNRQEELETPIMPCTIVDERIVDFGWEYLGTPQMDVINITVTQKKVVDSYTKYFTYLWQKSVPIKMRNRPIDRATVARLIIELKNREAG